jgi:broad specificity phosphatase PhoE
MKLILARHGETDGNVNYINQGQMEGQLTSNGRKQAIMLGKRLSDEKIDEIYVSDLRRCVQTAEHILIYHPEAIVHYSSLLRERSLGFLEGSKRGDVAKYSKESGLNILDYKPEGGESIREVKLRVKTFIDELMQKHNDETILIVSHGQFIANIILYIMKLDDTNYDTYKHDNTAISIITFLDKPILEVKSCTTHLNDNIL